MEIKVLKHEKNKVGYFYNHKALVEIENASDSKESIVYETSIKVNYHPLGYGIYGSRHVKKMADNQYVVTWSTGTSCD